MSDTPRQHERILAAIQAELWAITPEALHQVIAIAQGYGDPEAVAAKLGRPLDNTRTVTERDGVAVIPVTGPVFRYANLFTRISGATSIEQVALDFTAAMENPAIRGIVLEVDSPGGMVAGTSEMAAMIRDATKTKPVISYVSNLGASAGYWLPAAASEIVIADTAILGSIGTVMRAGVGKDANTVEIVSSQSPYKRLDASTEDGRARYQALVDAQAQVFVEAVAKYRGVSVETVLSDFGQGGVMVGQAAVDAGMADRLGSLESVIAELSAKPSPKKTFFMPGAKAPMNAAELKAQHPETYQAVFEEGRKAGRDEGAKAECERIKGVEAAALPGHEALIASLKFDGKTTAGDAALAVLNAEKANLGSIKGNIQQDAGKPAPHAPAPTSAEEAEAIANANREAANAANDQKGSWATAFKKSA